MTERELFSELCREDLALHGTDGDSIGTYNEKRLHRILKRFITEDANCYEVKIGRYVADVLLDGNIFEIQTGSFRSLSDKVRYYLENTEYTVNIIHPIICEKQLIRADKDTGEIIKVSRSPKRERATDALAQMYFVREHVPNERLCVSLLHVAAEEYRFSEAQRYRKKGRYDNDLRPTALVDETVLCSLDDLRALIPEELYGVEFSTAEFERTTKLSGRNRYYALATLCDLGIVKKRAEGRRSFYRI